MQLTKHAAAYEPLDELARQTMVRLMAEQGFVPAEKLEACRDQLERERMAKDKELDKSIDKRIVNMATEIAKGGST